MDFRRAFFPTEEESQRSRDFLEKMANEELRFWIEQGLTNEEIEKLTKLEIEEFKNTPRFNEYTGRSFLVKHGIITIEDVKEILD